ncbi:MAG: hypothetical protein AB1516_06000 [Pseudomonadota bacterium]
MEIDITFSCPCGAFVDELVYCEGPDATATTDEESQREYWESLCCDGCSKDFEVHIVSTFSETVVKIPGLVDLTYDVRDFVEEDMAADIQSTQQLEIYKKVTRDVISILRKGNDDDVQATLNNMLFAQVVTAVETYLSSSFIATVVNSEELIRRLVETDPELAKRQFSLKEIFTQWQDLKLLVARYLRDLIFHDLKKVKPMYLSVLDIDFGDVAWLFRAILIRHDCVHRSGFDKDGKQNEIDANTIVELVKQATRLVSEIEEQLAARQGAKLTVRE